ncbi:glycoside hydrolase family 2 TIM barrel-domain containing protein [Cyclonatronum proteinivorum]|nr:glycoside hydrolase family 2 TIM barrel-domain containing protein [Cyclonatronum proteinivorum]
MSKPTNMIRTKQFMILLSLLLMASVSSSLAQDRVHVQEDADGWRLLVDGEPLMVNGMNWDYFPIGTNYEYDFWGQSDRFIRDALDYEMRLLQNMGVNSIRVYTGITPEWVTYIYDNYGIYTMLNHSFGRYGVMLEDGWMANTEYSDPRVQELLLREVTEMVQEFRGTRGLLLYLLGNENNYGLFWGGAETEDIPVVDRQSTVRARAMYELFNDAALAMKEYDTDRPIAMANGDLLFMDLVVEFMPDMDIFGANVYRGETFTDLYDRVAAEYGKPVLLTEFGSDAFNARTNQEDQLMQAHFKRLNWLDIYQHAAGMGRAQNSIGGYTFQWSDGWWKYGQTVDLDVHNTNASWANGGYWWDYVEGENNMNEEWFGIMAKGPTDAMGHFRLFPRAAYYVLQEAHKIDVYAPGMSAARLAEIFEDINIMDAYLRARGDTAALEVDRLTGIRLSRFTADFKTFNTGGDKITTPESADPNVRQFPNEQGFDHMQSFYVGVEARPSNDVRAEVQFNVLANVAQNPIDEIFYENRGRQLEVLTPEGIATLEDVNRVKVYNASFDWNHRYFDLEGFYRTGRYHWGYEGDFFGLYPEANYGDQIDIYNGIAPFGFEMAGRREFDGFKFAFGPQLWWGANPAFLLKYRHRTGPWDMAAIYHEDIATQGMTESSFAVPQPKTRRVTFAATRDFGPLEVQGGVIWAGQPLNDREFQIYRNGEIFVDQINPEDNWGGKLKLTYQGGNFNWYAQSAVMGLVAQGGYDQTMTFTGWHLKDSGSGNQYNFLTGFAYQLGDFQIAPNFLWQQPIEGPIPADVAAPGRPRNILDDPFSVRANRETVAGELLITYDPTPATYMFDWNNDYREDAPFAASVGFIYRHHPTTQDAAIGILPDGRTAFAFPGAPPARDLWEAHARIVSRVSPDLGIIARLYGGEAEANGSDDRLIERFGGDLRVIYRNIMLNSFVRVNDWGPFDYHRDFNLTFPLQLMADVSMSLGEQDWFDMPRTRIGVRGTYRTLDEFSPRYAPAFMEDPSGQIVPNPVAPGFGNGNEWEFRTYIQINI